MSAYMTGVVEVQLPMDFKIKNIEDTEAAKKQMLGTAHKSAYRYILWLSAPAPSSGGCCSCGSHRISFWIHTLSICGLSNSISIRTPAVERIKSWADDSDPTGKSDLAILPGQA